MTARTPLLSLVLPLSLAAALANCTRAKQPITAGLGGTPSSPSATTQAPAATAEDPYYPASDGEILGQDPSVPATPITPVPTPTAPSTVKPAATSNVNMLLGLVSQLSQMKSLLQTPQKAAPTSAGGGGNAEGGGASSGGGGGGASVPKSGGGQVPKSSTPASGSKATAKAPSAKPEASSGSGEAESSRPSNNPIDGTRENGASFPFAGLTPEDKSREGELNDRVEFPGAPTGADDRFCLAGSCPAGGGLGGIFGSAGDDYGNNAGSDVSPGTTGDNGSLGGTGDGGSFGDTGDEAGNGYGEDMSASNAFGGDDFFSGGTGAAADILSADDGFGLSGASVIRKAPALKGAH